MHLFMADPKSDYELPNWIKQLEDLIEDAEAEARLERRRR